MARCLTPSYFDFPKVYPGEKHPRGISKFTTLRVVLANMSNLGYAPPQEYPWYTPGVPRECPRYTLGIPHIIPKMAKKFEKILGYGLSD
jgi:hypothetical protein